MRYITLCILSCFGAFAVGAAASDQPNVIVIVGDDMGYADISVHGCKDIPTPHIDSLAKSGVRCTNGYVSGAYCSPTRAGLLTGRYQQRFGHEFNTGAVKPPNIQWGLPVGEVTFADRMKSAGYATGMVGKWHLGHLDQYLPVNRGFDEYFGFLSAMHSFLDGSADIVRGKELVHEKQYLTDAFSREAVSFIERHEREPFFLYLAFNAVHSPLEATEKYLKRFESIKDEKRRTYAAMMSAMDDAIGNVLTTLRARKLEDNTLIFFISDNGGKQGGVASNTPFNGYKRTTWEGGIHVPFLVQWKGKLPAGKVYDQPVIQLDILPTALAACGIPVKPEWKLDGVNLLPYFAGEKSGPPHETLYWRFGPQMAIRKGDWKLVKATNDPAGAETLAANYDLSDALLFNLASDVGEKTNLAKREPDKAKELADAWHRWNAELPPPAWLPVP